MTAAKLGPTVYLERNVSGICNIPIQGFDLLPSGSELKILLEEYNFPATTWNIVTFTTVEDAQSFVPEIGKEYRCTTIFRVEAE